MTPPPHRRTFRWAALATLSVALVAGGVAVASLSSDAARDTAPTPPSGATSELTAAGADASVEQTAASRAVDEWITGLDLPADATDDERLQAKLAYDFVTVPLSERERLLALPGVRVVAPIAGDDTVSGAVLRSESDLVRSAIPDAEIQQNQLASADADQTPTPSWGLDVVDNAAAAQDSHYLYDNTGAGTTVFVMDTGVNSTLSDFGGRVDAAAGKDFVSDGLGTEDCNGHGTHVAGTVGSATYGVAKQTRIVPVRVFGCSGRGTTTDIWYALNWITTEYRWPDRMVINMSLDSASAWNVDNMISFANMKGFVVVGAAGNETQDACNVSPASSSSTITVGAFDNRRVWSGFSNYGSCVDILAPGQDIKSLNYQGGTLTASGTSMAAPHVSGLVARLLQANPSWVRADVMAFFTNAAATGRITGVPANTVNLVAAIPTSGAVPTITALTATAGANGLSLAWTTNGIGTFTAFSITVTDTTTTRVYPVTVSGTKSSTVFTNVVSGHPSSIRIVGTATVSSGASVTTDPVMITAP
ncbi:S8 family serine peptidase [Microbacterium sp. P26]|uniref:S8 family peptidase n=1 Tax=Microbacterium TaxID=33882 RepID=UPI002041C4A5|nr:S8 family peptidase [Microbacterium sp. P26]MCM3500410.1 S8 family serine peptidase [Microbacterium sp. P26]